MYSECLAEDNCETAAIPRENLGLSCDKEMKKEFTKKYRSLDSEYKNSCIEYEYRIQTLTDSLNVKSSIVEDQHQRIKILNAEYEELLNKCNKDKEYIFSLEEKISLIKKESNIKITEVNNELNDLKLSLERNNYLENKISSSKEKYEKAQQDIMSLTMKNEALEKNLDACSQMIEKLNSNLQKKDKEIELLDLKKKELENELIKHAEEYGFKINKKIFRNYSITSFENSIENILQRKSTRSVHYPKEPRWSEDLNGLSMNYNSLQCVNESSDDESNENRSTNNKENSSSHEKEKKLKKENKGVQEEIIFDLGNNEPRSKAESQDISEPEDDNVDNDNPIKILDDKPIGRDSYKNEALKILKKVNYKSVFKHRDSNCRDTNLLTNNEDKHHYSSVTKTHNQKNKLLTISNNFPTYNYQSSLQQMLDDEIEDLNNHKAYYGYNNTNTLLSEPSKALILFPSLSEQQEDKVYFNKQKLIKISFFFDILAVKKVSTENSSLDPLVLCPTSMHYYQYYKNSNYDVTILIKIIEELNIKNIELEAILANEKFMFQQEIKKQQAKIEKLLNAIAEIKKKVKGSF